MPTSKSSSKSRSSAGARSKKFSGGYTSSNKVVSISSVDETGVIDRSEMKSIGFSADGLILDDSAPIESVSGIGISNSNKLRAIGINTVGDLRRFNEFQESKPVRIKAGKIVDSVLITDERQGIFKEVNKPISNIKKDKVEKSSVTKRKTVIANRLTKSSVNANKTLKRRNNISEIQSKYKKVLSEKDSTSSKRYDKRKAELEKKVRELEHSGKMDYWEAKEYDEKKSADINRDYEYSDLSPSEMRNIMRDINADFEAKHIEPIPFSSSDFKQTTRSGLWSDIDRTVNYDYYNRKAVEKAKIIVEQMDTESKRDELAKKWAKRELVHIDQVRLMAKTQKAYRKDFDAINKEIDSAKTLDELQAIKHKKDTIDTKFQEKHLDQAKELSRIEKAIREDYEVAYIDDRAYELSRYSTAILNNTNISVGVGSKIDLSHKFDNHKKVIQNLRGKEEVIVKLNRPDLMVFPKTIGRASDNTYIKVKDGNQYTYYYNTDKKVSKISKNTYDKALKDVIAYYNAIDLKQAGKSSEHTVNYEFALMDIKTYDYIPKKYQTDIGNKFITAFPDISIGENPSDKSVKYLLAEQSAVGLATKHEFDKLNGFGYSDFDIYDGNNINYPNYQHHILNYKIKEHTKGKDSFSELRFSNEATYDLKNIKKLASMLGYKVKNNDYRPLFEQLLEDKRIMVKLDESNPLVVKFDNNYVMIAPTFEDKDD